MMKKSLLGMVLLFSLSAFANPQESVTATVQQLMNIMQNSPERERVGQLCALVEERVENEWIGEQFLGTFAKFRADQAGITKFYELVPSILVDQFYDVLNDLDNYQFRVTGTTPKGSWRTGVNVVIGGQNFTITVNNANDKIVDLEYRGFSMVRMKGSDFQRELRGDRNNGGNTRPVSALVTKLEARGVTHCK